MRFQSLAFTSLSVALLTGCASASSLREQEKARFDAFVSAFESAPAVDEDLVLSPPQFEEGQRWRLSVTHHQMGRGDWQSAPDGGNHWILDRHPFLDVVEITVTETREFGEPAAATVVWTREYEGETHVLFRGSTTSNDLGFWSRGERWRMDGTFGPRTGAGRFFDKTLEVSQERFLGRLLESIAAPPLFVAEQRTSIAVGSSWHLDSPSIAGAATDAKLVAIRRVDGRLVAQIDYVYGWKDNGTAWWDIEGGFVRAERADRQDSRGEVGFRRRERRVELLGRPAG